MVGRRGPLVEVLAGAEAAAGAGQNHHPRIAERVERVAYLAVHLDVEAVEPVGAVERDPRDPGVRLEVDGFVGHARGLAKEGAWTQTIWPRRSRIACSRRK